MKRTICTACTIMTLLPWQSLGADPVHRYTLVDLTVEAGHDVGSAKDVNEAGQVVGRSGPGWVRWNPIPGDGWLTTPLEYDNPFCFAIEGARAINNHGDVVGSAICDFLVHFALLWEAEENLAVQVTFGNATDINDLGQIVGNYLGAWVWDNGNLTTLGSGDALGINEHSEIVGWVGDGVEVMAALWTPKESSGWETIELGTLGGTISLALDINEKSQVVGVSRLPDRTSNAFLWQDGSMSDLGALGGLPVTIAQAINNRGEVVGYAVSGDDTIYRPFLWHDGTMYDLNDLVVPEHKLELRGARGINDRGQIVGWSKSPPNGDFHAFLLNPVTAGDVDADGVVDENDLATLLLAWGPCADCSGPLACLTDLDGDCSVGTSDLLILLVNWG